MNFDKPTQELPDEIIVKTEELKVNTDGKKYLHEKDGVFYGGDYLSELPKEITVDKDFPPAPPEVNHVL